MLALSGWWFVGWAVGLVVVAIAAALLIIVIGLGRRITGQAVQITRALDGGRANTDGMWEVRSTNSAIDRITRGLARARGAEDPR